LDKNSLEVQQMEQQESSLIAPSICNGCGSSTFKTVDLQQNLVEAGAMSPLVWTDQAGGPYVHSLCLTIDLEIIWKFCKGVVLSLWHFRMQRSSDEGLHYIWDRGDINAGD